MSHEIDIVTSKEDFLLDYLKVFNGVWILTEKQLECLYHMIQINTVYTATTEIRKALVKRLDVKGVPDVANLVKSLKDKGVIIEDRANRRYVYHSDVVPNSVVVKINFRISNETKEK